MVNKIFGVKNITHLLYGIIVLLPMMAILGRVCYTVANKNANQSYSDTYVYKNEKISSSAFNPELKYTAYVKDGTWANENTQYTFTYISLTATQLNITQADYDTLGKWNLLATNRIQLRNTSGSLITTFTFDKNNVTSFSFIGNISPNFFNAANVYQIIMQENKLDNAFEYSLKTFTDDNNLGEVDMFSWFTDLFLDHSNPHNQIYIGFVNWYLNYTMLVSCGYLFFLVLIWFINFIRRILDKSMYQDYGGF